MPIKRSIVAGSRILAVTFNQLGLSLEGIMKMLLLGIADLDMPTFKLPVTQERLLRYKCNYVLHRTSAWSHAHKMCPISSVSLLHTIILRVNSNILLWRIVLHIGVMLHPTPVCKPPPPTHLPPGRDIAVTNICWSFSPFFHVVGSGNAYVISTVTYNHYVSSSGQWIIGSILQYYSSQLWATSYSW